MATDVSMPDEDARLLALIDRFELLLERSDLAELEVEAGGTVLRLAKPVPPPSETTLGIRTDGLTTEGQPAPFGRSAAATGEEQSASGVHAVLAPLTGVFYGSPSPEAAPYLREGGTVSTGQVIGLIEAMKLFNEIKSDVTGTVHRIAAESGALVKQKQTLIEVVPS